MVVPSLFNDMNLDITCILVAVPGLGRYYQHWIMLALKFKFNLKILCKVKFCNLKSSRLKCIPWRKRSIQDIMDSVGTYEIASQVWSKKNYLASFIGQSLVLEWTPKYQNLNTLNIECPNIKLSEHHILAQNQTLNMSNITKNWTVREHQTVSSKTSLVT